MALYWTGSKNIKDLLGRVLNSKNWAGLSVLDFPAGSGYTATLLNEKKANVAAADLFPQFFKHPTLKCINGDLLKPFPYEANQFDFAICQEGIEHVSDQLAPFKEFHRVLKPNGRLIITTPNYSNFRSRFAYLCMEAETPKMLPPNEIESIWHGEDSKIYFGHIFPMGIMRLRILAHLGGFKIAKIHASRVNYTSLLLALVLYPFTILHSYKVYLSALRKNRHQDKSVTKKIFKELVWLNNHPSVLLGGHLIVELEKCHDENKLTTKFKSIDIT